MSTVFFLLLSLFLTVILNWQSDVLLKKTASQLIAAHNQQLEMNMNSYLTKVEKAASLLYSEEEYYSFDPGDENLDPYEKQEITSDMTDRINDLGILDNYTDFSVVYYNDDRIGWLSKVTRAMYSDKQMYEDFASILKNGNGDRAWVFGLNGNTDHLYYLKRYNSKAIIMVSFYSLELKQYFVIPEELNGMDVALVDNENHILYANDEDRIGEQLPEETVNTLGDVTNGSVTTKDLLVTSNTCENGWRIVCTMSYDFIARENASASRDSLGYVLAMVILILWLELRQAKAMNLSAAGIVETLQDRAEHDLMTGLYNKTEFEQAADEKLSHQKKGFVYSYTIIDLDRFKQINDTYGHSAGDEVLIEFAGLIRENFSENSFITGRLGGDEFGIFAELEESEAEVHQQMEQRLQNMRKELSEKKFRSGDMKVSFSSGTVNAEEEDTSFRKLNKRADVLLYHGKRSGRGRDESEAADEKAE